MMLAMGMRVRFDEVLATARKPRLVIQGLVANFILVPIVTLGLLYVFHSDPLVCAGFLILAVCPGAPVGPPFASIARGDVPYAVGQMVILAGLSAILAPALLSVLLAPLLPPGTLHIDYLAIARTLLIAQVAPLAVGLGLQRWAPKLTERIAKPVGVTANLLLLGVIALLLMKEYHTLEVIRLRGWIGMVVLLSASLGIGWVCGGPGLSTRKSLALTTAIRNAAVGLVIVSGNFAETPAVTAVVAYAFVSILGSLGVALLLGAAATRGSQAITPLVLPITEKSRG
jgi:BASS family bile acid:Na+ symporter